MSSFIIVGLFSLRAGHFVYTSVPRRTGGTGTICHAQYSTAVVCRAVPHLPAELRVFSRGDETFLPDQTVAFVVAKVYVPPANVPGDLQLDAMHLAPFPGNPCSDSYDCSLPNFPCPLVFGHGTVSDNHSTLDNGQVVFPVAMSEYVWRLTQQSTILYPLSLSHQLHSDGRQLHLGQALPSMGQHPTSYKRQAIEFCRNVFSSHARRCARNRHREHELLLVHQSLFHIGPVSIIQQRLGTERKTTQVHRLRTTSRPHQWGGRFRSLLF